MSVRSAKIAKRFRTAKRSGRFFILCDFLGAFVRQVRGDVSSVYGSIAICLVGGGWRLRGVAYIRWLFPSRDARRGWWSSVVARIRSGRG